MISTALLLINLGLAKDDGIAGRWFATGITTATIEIATNPQSDWVGTIVQCDTSDWIGKALLTDFERQPDGIWIATLHSPKYSVSKEVRLERVSQTELEVVADFVVFEKRFLWHSAP